GDRVKRREFITLLGGAAAWPVSLSAQQAGKLPTIGLLGASTPSGESQRGAAFVHGLGELGWIENRTVAIEVRLAEGRNIRIDTRWTTADVESIQRFAKELVALQPELVVSTSTPSTAWMLQQTRTIPIIFTNVSDPVGSGFVASLPRPGGNVTGFS